MAPILPASSVPVVSLIALGLVYLPLATALARTDLREHRLPNRLVACLSIGVLGVLGATAALVEASRPAVAMALVLGAAVGVLAVIAALVAPDLMGMGDAKVMPAVIASTAVMGWDVLVAAVGAAALIGGIAGVGTMARTRDVRARFAYGPVLLVMPLAGLLGAPAVRAALGL